MRLVERVANVTHFALESQFSTVGSDNATRFLPAMLKRVQAKVRHSRRFRMSVDSEDATLFTQFRDFDHDARIITKFRHR
jgi:hypothetical protein